MLQIIGGDFLEAEERKTAMSHDEMQDYWKRCVHLQVKIYQMKLIS